MSNPLTVQVCYATADLNIPALYYDGTNVSTISSYVGAAGWTFVSKNAANVCTFTRGSETRTWAPGQWVLYNEMNTILDDIPFKSVYTIGPVANAQDYRVRQIATASIKTPMLAIGVATDVTLTLDETMLGTDYAVKVIPGATLLGQTSAAVKIKTTTQVVLTMTSTGLISAGGTLTVIAVR